MASISFSISTSSRRTILISSLGRQPGGKENKFICKLSRRMGSSLSCLSPPRSSLIEANVFVVKESGKFIKFRQGTRLKEIVAGHPYHMAIRCGSKQSLFVLPDCFELEYNGLYFLLPEGMALCSETFDTLMRLAESKEPSTTADDHDHSNPGQVLLFNASFEFEYKKTPWKPALHTIPEIVSPYLHADV